MGSLKFFGITYGIGSPDTVFSLDGETVHIYHLSVDQETGDIDTITAEFTKKEFAQLLDCFQKEGKAELRQKNTLDSPGMPREIIVEIIVERREDGQIKLRVKSYGGILLVILPEIPPSVFELFGINTPED